jgi:hypothetical protein
MLSFREYLMQLDRLGPRLSKTQDQAALSASGLTSFKATYEALRRTLVISIPIR